MFNLDEMGLRIARRRKELGLTQDQLAKQLDLSPQAISKWETGAGMPDIASLPYLAKALDMSIDALFGQDRSDKNLEQEDLAQNKQTQQSFTNPILDLEDIAQTDLDFIYQYEDKVLLSDLMPEKTQGAVVSFEDGSQANLLTGSVLNMGNGHIIISNLEHYIESQQYIPNVGPIVEETAPSETLNEELGPYLKDVRSLNLELRHNTDVRIVPVENAEDIGVFFPDPNDQEAFFIHIEGNCLTIRDQSRDQAFPNSFLRQAFNWGKSQGERAIEIRLLAESERLSVHSVGASDIHCQVAFEEAQIQVSGVGNLEASKLSNVSYHNSGVGDIDIGTVHNFKYEGSGASDVHLKMVTGDVSIRTSGAGDIKIERGNLEHFVINTSGVGDIQAEGVTTNELDCSLSGHGNVIIGRVLGASREKVSMLSSLRILERK